MIIFMKNREALQGMIKGKCTFAGDNMKRRRIQRMCLAWLLLATILPMLVVKSVHHHDAVRISTELAIHSLQMEQSTHFCATDNGCPICHFLVSPYTEVHTYVFHCLVPYVSFYRPVIHKQVCDLRLVYTHGLRAPPFLMC